MPKVEATLSKESHQKWMELCKAHGKKSASLLRRYIEGVTQGEAPAHSDSFKETKTNAIKFDLSDQDFEAITERAKTENFPSRPAWVKHQVFTALDGRPPLKENEISELRKSSHELMAIGRNLNQITHQLNIDSREGHKVTVDMIEALAGRIDRHMEKVYQLINDSQSRKG